MAIITRYVNFGTGTDDLAVGRGESTGDPWKTLSFAITNTASNSGNDVLLEVEGTAYDTGGRLDGSGYTATSLTINAPEKTSADFQTSVPTLDLTDVATAAIYWRSTATPLQINNLQIRSTLNTVDSKVLTTAGLSGAAGVSMTNVYASVINNNAKAGRLIEPVSGTGTNRFVNCILRLTGSVGTASDGFRSDAAGRSTYGCIVDGAFDIGFYRIPTMKNCVAIGATDSYSTVGSTVSTCFGDDSAGDPNITNITNWAAEYPNYLTGNYALSATAPNLVDGGTNVSAENGGVLTDLIGVTRGATWDGGATEYDAPSALVLSGPDTATEGIVANVTGTELGTVTTFSLQTDDTTHSLIQNTWVASSAIAGTFTAESGVNDATPGSPASGVPMEPTVSAAGVTLYQIQMKAEV